MDGNLEVISMVTNIRVDLVGAGFHFRGYHPVYGVPVKVVGINDTYHEARETFARNRGVRACSTLKQCDAVDVIDPCTPLSTHAPLTVAWKSIG